MIPVKGGRDFTRQIPQNERIIPQNDNNFTIRQFKFPRIVENVDISDYSFILQVQPVNQNSLPYYNILSKEVTESDIILTWKVKRHDTQECGELKVNLNISDSEDNVFHTYTGEFKIAKGIKAEQQSEIIPPSVFEQAVTEATRQADIAKDSADISVNAKNTVIEKAEQVSEQTDEVNSLHDDVVDKHGDIVSLHADIVNKSSQVSQDASQVSADKSEIADMYNTVSENTETVLEKAQEVSVNANAVNINTQTVLQSKEVIENLAEDVALNTQQVSDDKSEIVGYKNEVSDNAQVVLAKADVVNSQMQLVVENTETVVGLAEQVSQGTQEVSTNTQTVADNLETVLEKTAEALQSATNALVSEQNAHTSADNAEVSNQSALTAMQTAVQAMTDLLAMLGSDVATLTNGKLTHSQVPAIAITDTFVVSSQAEMLALICETGDIAIRTDQNKTYILQGTDPSVLSHWQQLQVPTNYTDTAGHAVTADNAENANKINNKRLVSMTESQYEAAVKDPDTYYTVVPD